MADPKSALERLIEERDGVLVRHKKHKVYHFPNGATFTVASTPECPLAYDNALSLLKTLLGAHPPDRGLPGERREKRLKRKPMGCRLPSFKSEGKPLETSTWKEKLALVVMQLAMPTGVTPALLRLPFEERVFRGSVNRLEG